MKAQLKPFGSKLFIYLKRHTGRHLRFNDLFGHFVVYLKARLNPFESKLMMYLKRHTGSYLGPNDLFEIIIRVSMDTLLFKCNYTN